MREAQGSVKVNAVHRFRSRAEFQSNLSAGIRAVKPTLM